MGFLWEGSTGARAVQLLRKKEPGTIMLTPELAKALGAKQTLLHQLLSNALNLRLLKKVRVPGSAFTGWKLGAGNVSANIEPKQPPRPAPTTNESARRKAAAARRAARIAERAQLHASGLAAVDRPPGFQSVLAPSYRLPRIELPDRDDDVGTVAAESALPRWLAGLSTDIAAVRSRGRPDERQRIAACSRPAAYLARWHVLYRDARGQFNGELQVQAVHPELGALDAWCRIRGGIARFECAGFVRVTDERSGYPVDLLGWLEKPTGKPPLVKPPLVKCRRVRSVRMVDGATVAAEGDLDRKAALAELKRRVFLNEPQAAMYIGLTVQSFRELLHAGSLPTSRAPRSGELRWRRTELSALRTIGRASGHVKATTV